MNDKGYTIQDTTLIIHHGYVLPYLYIPCTSFDTGKDGTVITLDTSDPDEIQKLGETVVKGPYINGPIQIQSGIALLLSKGKRGTIIEYCF